MVVFGVGILLISVPAKCETVLKHSDITFSVTCISDGNTGKDLFVSPIFCVCCAVKIKYVFFFPFLCVLLCLNPSGHSLHIIMIQILCKTTEDISLSHCSFPSERITWKIKHETGPEIVKCGILFDFFLRIGHYFRISHKEAGRMGEFEYAM